MYVRVHSYSIVQFVLARDRVVCDAGADARIRLYFALFVCLIFLVVKLVYYTGIWTVPGIIQFFVLAVDGTGMLTVPVPFNGTATVNGTRPINKSSTINGTGTANGTGTVNVTGMLMENVPLMVPVCR